MPDWGRDTGTGAIVHISNAARDRVYVCPVCRLRLEFRRGNVLEYFAHWRGLEGTRACELFAPDEGARVQPAPAARRATVAVRPDARVEDDPSDAGLMIDLLDGHWCIGLRLPEVATKALGEISLAELRPAIVELADASATARVSVLELVSGGGSSRMVVPPDVAPYHTRTSGTWPASIDRTRWEIEARGLEPKGTLFRLRRGEWTRLLAGSGVHLAETLLVAAETRSAPPVSLVRESHGEIVNAARHWQLWEVSLPATDIDRAATTWLSELGHSIVPRRWSFNNATLPRTYTDEREPVYWVGDAALLSLEAPTTNAQAFVSLSADSNTYSATVNASDGAMAHLAITSRAPGRARVHLGGARTANFDVVFVARPSEASILELLDQTPRLRVWVGEDCYEAWNDAKNIVPVGPAVPEVRVELGPESVRAAVTVWQRGRRRISRSLAAHEVERTIAAALGGASLIEIDADNLGRVSLEPRAITHRPQSASRALRRLDAYDRALRLLTDHTAGPHASALRATAIVRARLAARRSNGGAHQ